MITPKQAYFIGRYTGYAEQYAQDIREAFSGISRLLGKDSVVIHQFGEPGFNPPQMGFEKRELNDGRIEVDASIENMKFGSLADLGTFDTMEEADAFIAECREFIESVKGYGIQ